MNLNSSIERLIKFGWGDMPGALRAVALETIPDRCHCGGSLRHRSTSAGKARLSCRKCEASYTLNRFVPGAKYLPPQKVCDLAKEYLRGISARFAGRRHRICFKTVARLFQTFRLAAGAVNCACGRPATHRGLCTFRLRYARGRWHKRGVRRK